MYPIKKLNGSGFTKLLCVFALFMAFTLNTSTTAFAQDYKTEFTVSMENPWNHYLDVEMTINDLPKKNYIDVIQPVWTPGSYKLREYSMFIQEEKAYTADGKAVKFEKIAKNIWRIYAKGLKTVKFAYRVFAFEKSIRHSYLDTERAIIAGPHTFMYPEPFKMMPVKVKINPYKDFKEITTGMEHDPNDKFTVYADDFDILFDSPMEVSNQDIATFVVDGATYVVSVSGNKDHDLDLITKNTRRVVEETVKVLGVTPYKKYVFFYTKGVPGGGIEHLNSTFLGMGAWGLNDKASVERTTGLVAHEFFHAWNVKRIRPFVLGPFDYTKENYVKSLWIAEGFTSYYADLIKLRAGYNNDSGYLRTLAGQLKRHFSTPGRFIQSTEEASYDAWIKSYLNHQNSRNTTISYYPHGSLLGTLIDLQIADGTNGGKNLDDLMKYLYDEYHIKKDRGFKPDEFQKAAEKLAQKDMNKFFNDHVRGKKEIDMNEFLVLAGLKLEIKEGRKDEAFFGASMRDANGKLIVRFVTDDSPAYKQGISINDEIVGIDLVRTGSMNDFNRILNGHSAGDVINVVISRNEHLQHINIKLGAADKRSYKIVKLDGATEKQKIVYEKWLGHKF